MEFINQNIMLYLMAYLISGIPFGYLLAKQFAGIDIKKAGSGNIGATNVLRVVKEKDPKLAKKLGAATLLLDATKGMAIILLAKMLGASIGVQWTIAVLSVVGHCFSAFLLLEGGKGVATGLGVLLVIMPIPAAIAIITWIIASKGLKIVSISSLIGMAALVLASYILYPEIEGIGTHAPVWIIAFIIFYKHTPNIVRVFQKQENKIG